MLKLEHNATANTPSGTSRNRMGVAPEGKYAPEQIVATRVHPVEPDCADRYEWNCDELVSSLFLLVENRGDVLGKELGNAGSNLAGTRHRFGVPIHRFFHFLGCCLAELTHAGIASRSRQGRVLPHPVQYL